MSRSRSRPGCASGPLCYLPLRDPLFRVYLYLPRLTVPGLIWGPAARDAVIVTGVITRTRQVPETRYPYNRENIWFLHSRRWLIRELTNANIISEAHYNVLVFAPYRTWRTKCEHGLGLPHLAIFNNIVSVFLTFLSIVLVRWRREQLSRSISNCFIIRPFERCEPRRFIDDVNYNTLFIAIVLV